MLFLGSLFEHGISFMGSFVCFLLGSPTYMTMTTSPSKCVVSLLAWLIEGLKWLTKLPNMAY